MLAQWLTKKSWFVALVAATFVAGTALRIVVDAVVAAAVEAVAVMAGAGAGAVVRARFPAAGRWWTFILGWWWRPQWWRRRR